MKWPLISRRRHEREVQDISADRERIRSERDQFEKDRDTHKVVAKTAARQFTDADEELAAARKRVTELVKENDVLREQAAAEVQVGRGEWRARCQRAEKRADRLQRELDAALGLDKGVPADSAPWQPGYTTPTPGKGVAS